MNIMLMSPYADEVAKVIVEEQVPIVTTGAGSPSCHSCINIFCLDDFLFIILMYLTFIRHYEMSTHLHTGCPQHKGRRHPSAVDG